jgi:NAD(P)-dependent dehydrogenase (short-subunit alcohol dehydrogenase family)
MGIEEKSDLNRVALVVGGAGDIGAAICARLLQDGYGVVISSLELEQATATVKALDDSGGRAYAEVLDLADESRCKDVITSIVSRFGKLDVLVNCAGVSYIAPVLLGKTKDWRRVLEVNTLGAFTISRAVLRPMIRAHYGRIIHIGSISADVGAPFNAIYAASKAGIAGLVRSLALEIAATGITVNAVQPGYVKTRLFAQTQGARAKIKGVDIDTHESDLIAETPTRRLVTPEDVASLVAYLAGDESRSITGQTINVDGGRTAS